MDGMSCLQTVNHVVEKEGTYGWNVLFVNNMSRGYNGVPMDGMCCLQTMN